MRRGEERRGGGERRERKTKIPPMMRQPVMRTSEPSSI